MMEWAVLQKKKKEVEPLKKQPAATILVPLPPPSWRQVAPTPRVRPLAAYPVHVRCPAGGCSGS